jgi:hypothetical protein
MEYRFNNFVILTTKEEYKTNFKVIAWKETENQKEYTELTKDMFSLIDFIEVLKGFTANKMDTSTLYEFEFFTAKVKGGGEDKRVVLSIKFTKLNKFIQVDKLKAQIIASKISKVISRVEL